MVSTRIPGIRLSSQESAARIMAHPAVCFGLYVDSGAGGRKKKKKKKQDPTDQGPREGNENTREELQENDTVRVQARDFGRDRASVITAEINRKYSNKVLPEIGLCIALFDLLDASEGKVLYGDGCLYHRVEFTLVVFRPFIGEHIIGTVKFTSPAGVRVSLKFFDDIYIPLRSLQTPSAYDPSLNEFFWASEYSDPEMASSMPADLLSCGEEQRLYMQIGQPIRIRIEQEHFLDVSPKEAPKAPAPSPDGAEANSVEEQLRKEREEGIPPYSLIASCDGPGLGIIAWWQSEEDGQQDQQ
ncbi:hypothetical protein PCANC_15536 [Puccinia coronata f. sp. avenae]|uniref:RNA polymerase III subunit Rpc25 domain-containing protein n=1 Tax=Puccinia coronata f. sp. avenae TaxID=200324 RepID=A0A2N5SIS6_9BASI|nr:hypothetical protein PCANC_15536 [Puccinia coronata f. sp. avenae]